MSAAGTVARVRTALRGAGKACISAGVLILLFVAYQLWGTGIAEARSQRALKREFAASLATTATTAPVAPTTAPRSTDQPTTTTTTAPPAALPPPPSGSAVAIIKIPKIGVNSAVVEGVGVTDLEKGPGHYPHTPIPGQAGNAAVAGHRTTYGAPFYRLNELGPGDDIYVTTRDGAFDYRVMFSQSVSPSDVSVLNPTRDNRLTLTTCTPRFTATQRLVVVASLVGPVDPRPPAPVVAAASPATTIPGDTTGGTTGTASAPTTIAGTDVGSLSGQGASTAPAVAWGAVCAVVWALAWVGSRRWRKWMAYVVAAPLFLVALYFFFENFARFVPANL